MTKQNEKKRPGNKGAGYKTRLIIPAVFSLIAFGLLLTLSVWQFSRFGEKTGYIASFRSNLERNPVGLEELLASAGMMPADASSVDPTPDGSVFVNRPAFEFRKVTVTGQLLFDREMYVVGYSVNGDPGFKIMNPMLLNSGAVVMVERGWVSAATFARENRPETLPDEPQVTVKGLIRFPTRPNAFIPDNEPHNQLWFSVDLPEIFASMRAGDLRLSEDMPLLPFYILADANPYGAYPQGRQWQVNIHNPHLGYAFTWLALALALAVIFGVYVRSARKASNSPDNGDSGNDAERK